MTRGARMRGATRLNLARTHSQQMTLVFKHTPQLPSHRGIVPPIAPPPANATAPPFAFQRGQIFSTNQAPAMEPTAPVHQLRTQSRHSPIPPSSHLPLAFQP